MIAAMDNNFSVEDQSIINQIHQNQINSQSQRSTDLNATPGQYGQTSNHRTDTQYQQPSDDTEIEPHDNFSEYQQSSQMTRDDNSKMEKSVSKQMFGNRGKMTKKDMQNNMRAMLAKTKVADTVVSSSTTNTGS